MSEVFEEHDLRLEGVSVLSIRSFVYNTRKETVFCSRCSEGVFQIKSSPSSGMEQENEKLYGNQILIKDL